MYTMQLCAMQFGIARPRPGNGQERLTAEVLVCSVYGVYLATQRTFLYSVEEV